MSEAQSSEKPKRRLVLCFDGTGNHFQGEEQDTNVVKLYELMDRRSSDQYHYYQPGIGTYSENEGTGLLKYWSKFKSTVGRAIDQGVGTTFKEHVVAGYRFLMRYYQDGDEIYIFGFSRGAYTARFLSQMVFRVGLLSMGNEEMVHFAWGAFSDWLHVTGDGTAADRQKRAYMQKFKSTFCRENVKVLFLGLFDCVNSVGQFEMPLGTQSYKHMPLPPATHIRHAVSIHERRLKFKPALFSAELHSPSPDVKEVWFAGNHADVGGGWPRVEGQPALLSDEPLQWMIEEILSIPVKHKLALKNTKYEAPPAPTPQAKADFRLKPSKHISSLAAVRRSTMRPHDMLAPGGGVGLFSVLTWWILEVLPFFTRLELEHGNWVPRHWPPNMGASRDIPEQADIHHSVYRMHRAGVIKSLPKLGGDEPPMLTGLSTALFRFNSAGGGSEEGAQEGNATEDQGQIPNGGKT